METILAILQQCVREAIAPGTAAVIIAVIGLNLHFGYTGLINIGQSGFMLVGAYGFAISLIHGIPLPLAILIGLLVGVVFALILGIPTLKLRGDYLAIVTISASEIVRFVGRLSMLEHFTGGALGLRGSKYNGPFLKTSFLPDTKFTLIDFNFTDVAAGSGTAVVLAVLAIVLAVVLGALAVRVLLRERVALKDVGLVLAVAVVILGALRLMRFGLDRESKGFIYLFLLLGAALIAAAVVALRRWHGALTGRQGLLVVAVPYLLVWLVSALLILGGDDANGVHVRTFGLLGFGVLLGTGTALSALARKDAAQPAALFMAPGFAALGALVLYVTFAVAEGGAWIPVLVLVAVLALVGAGVALRAVGLSTQLLLATCSLLVFAVAAVALFFTFPVTFTNNVAQGWWVRLVAWSLVGFSLMLITLLVHSPWGRLLRGIREDEDAMRSLGKNVFSMKMQSLVIGGAFGALGGMVYVLPTTVQPDAFGRSITFFAYTALLLGGAATIFGPVLGTVLFYAGRVLIQGVTDAYVPASIMSTDQSKQFSYIVVGIVLMLLIIFRPQGILGDEKELRINV